MDLLSLPGGDIVAAGLADIAAGRETEASLLVRIGGPRLRRLGFPVPERTADDVEDYEIRLYHLLGPEHGNNAHARYNALIRRLVSFERAAACVR